MPLVTMRQILDHAAENNYGVPAYGADYRCFAGSQKS